MWKSFPSRYGSSFAFQFSLIIRSRFEIWKIETYMMYCRMLLTLRACREYQRLQWSLILRLGWHVNLEPRQTPDSSSHLFLLSGPRAGYFTGSLHQFTVKSWTTASTLRLCRLIHSSSSIQCNKVSLTIISVVCSEKPYQKGMIDT